MPLLLGVILDFLSVAMSGTVDTFLLLPLNWGGDKKNKIFMKTALSAKKTHTDDEIQL